MNAFARDIRPALPDAIEAEQVLLGALLVIADANWRAAGVLKPQHFSDQLHGKLYRTVGALIAERSRADRVASSVGSPVLNSKV